MLSVVRRSVMSPFPLVERKLCSVCNASPPYKTGVKKAATETFLICPNFYQNSKRHLQIGGSLTKLFYFDTAYHILSSIVRTILH
jgi:hypothetical protein